MHILLHPLLSLSISLSSHLLSIFAKNLPTPLNTERSQLTIDDLKKTTSYRATLQLPKFTTVKIGNTLKKNPPWRANNSNPNEFYRFNYLDNEFDEKRKTHLIKTLSLDSTTHTRNNTRKKSTSATPMVKKPNGKYVSHTLWEQIEKNSDDESC
jgi:hypothetical protein